MTQHHRKWKVSRISAILVILALIFLSITALGARACTEPIDVSGTVSLPRVIAEFKKRDEIAFPAHAILGSALGRFSCQPLAIGLQWLKAAGHARSQVDVDLVGRELAALRTREVDSNEVDDFLCLHVRMGVVNANQFAAIQKAGLHCPVSPPQPP